MQTLWQDLRYGVRMLIKNPGFTFVAVLTLSLGIGATTAIFSVVNAVLLKPLPYREPTQLVRLYSEFPTMNLRKFWVSPPEFMDIQKEAKSWESMGAWATGGVNVGTSSAPLRVNSTQITRSLIDTLNVQPMLGRNFTAEEDRVGGPRTAILAYSLWQRAFGGRTDIVGQQVRINEQPATVVGIMPKDYSFPPGSNDPVEVWVPFQFDPANPGNRGGHFLNVIGRLKAGVTIDQARAELLSLQEGWKSEARARHLLNAQFHPTLLFSLQEDVVGAAKPAVLMLLGAVGFVLLIACANVASLLLARAEARQREFAVRLALGAGRFRLLKQFLLEGTLLVLLGAAAGVLLAGVALKLILAAAPDSVPRSSEITIDAPVLLFTLGVSALSVFLFALAPLLQLRETGLSSTLHGASKGTAGGTGSQWLRQAMVVTEIALALILVIGSGLMIRAFWKLRQVDLGFNPQNVLSFSVQLPPNNYQTAGRLRFAETLQQKLAALPGVQSAALAGGLPPLRPINANDTDIEDYQKTTDNDPQENVDFWNIVSEDYFQAMGIRTIEGRTFTAADRSENAQRVVVINQTLARRFWKTNPIGRRLSPPGPPPAPGAPNQPTWYTVVGIVEDTKNLGVEQPAGTELYFLQPQTAATFGGVTSQMNFVVRSNGDPMDLANAIRGAVREIDAGLPLYRLETMSDLVARSLVRPRFLSTLLTAFSAIALALAAVGIYGVMAYSVSRRTQEIGVRMALGANALQVITMILSHGAKLTGAGIVIGLVGALALTRLVAKLLFEVSATDPMTFLGVVTLLAFIALLACYLPARRAAQVDPMIALRSE